MNTDQTLNSEITTEYKKSKVELLSSGKFTLLYIFSLGLYGLWWMYKSWRFFKEKDRLDIIPGARAIFAIFFLYSLFERIKTYAAQNKHTAEYSSGGLYIMFIIFQLCGRLPNPFWLASLLGLLCFIPPVEALNKAIENSEEYDAVHLSGYNNRQTTVLIIGGVFWLLIIVGMLYGGQL